MDCRSCPMKDRIALLEGIILHGKPVPDLDLDRAIRMWWEGDDSALKAIIAKQKGGEAPLGNRQPETRHTGNNRSL